ncbi:MAG TPA: CoA-binding protein [Gemmataceae bacterium]|nr:CoA-binding protein [Gemmataceae bacterium]
MPGIAVIGASSDRRKFGNKCVRAYAARGWDVYPVHPREPSVEGRPAFRSVLDVPADPLDRASVYLPASAGRAVMDELARRKVGEVFLNPGADDPAVVARARELGLNVVTACSIIAIGISPHDLPEA